MSSLTQPWLVILAAGSSRRFGKSKALASWNSRTLLEHMISIAQSSAGERVAIVTGHEAERLRPYLASVLEIFNADWPRGMGSSIACAIRQLKIRDPSVEFIWILPIDQPLVEATHLQALFEVAKRFNKVAMTKDQKENTGPPVCIPQIFFDSAMTLHGEKGLKSILKEHDITVLYNQNAFQDADTPERLQELFTRYSAIHQRPF